MIDTDNKHQAALDKIDSIPIVKTLGIEITELTEDVIKVRAPHDRTYDGVFDSFHGGLLMTIADTISCFLIIRRDGPDVRIATTDMNIRFLAPCQSDITAEARFLKAGRTLNPIEINLFDDQGVKVAVAQVCYIKMGQKTPKTGVANSQ